MAREYTFFAHTADVGAAVRGATLRGLFRNAALALCDLTCDRRAIRPRRTLRVRASGADLEDLLVRWLTEILYLHETRGLVFSGCAVDRVDRGRFRVSGRVRGEPLDRRRHRLRREVKAVTYHQIRLRRWRGAWRVRLVFDI